MIYLDNAATTFLKPSSVTAAMSRAMREYGANPGRGSYETAARAGRKIYSVREAAARMFSCSVERTVFTASCTCSLNTAINGILKKGDHVIISCLEHNSVLRAVHRLALQGIISYDIFEVNARNDELTLQSVRSLIRKNTRALICTAVSNVFGTVLPVKSLGEMLRKRGILFILDAAQAAGSHLIDMKEQCIDVLCLPGHKGLFGPMGTGLLLFADNVDICPLTVGGTGSNSLSLLQPELYPDALESGTVNLPGIAGLGAGLSFVRGLGRENILSREWELIRLLRRELSVIKGIRLYENMYPQGPTNLISFNLRQLHSEQVSEYLSRRGIALRAGYHCSALAHKSGGTSEQGAVRVSVGPFNTKKDIKNLVFYLNKIAMNKKM